MKFGEYINEEVNLRKIADDLMYKFRLTRRMISVSPNPNTGEDQISIIGQGPIKHIKNYVEEKYPELKFSGKKRGKAFFIDIWVK